MSTRQYGEKHHMAKLTVQDVRIVRLERIVAIMAKQVLGEDTVELARFVREKNHENPDFLKSWHVHLISLKRLQWSLSIRVLYTLVHVIADFLLK